MKNNINSLQYFTIICNIKDKNKMMSLLQENRAHGIGLRYGRGSAKKGALAQAFGFETEEKKAVITCLLPTDKSKELMEILHKKYNFIKENTGIAFTVPVEGLMH